MSIFHLNDKLIVVTGASSGIGKTCAITCSEYGARVILVGRSKERLNETFNALKGDGHVSVALDLTDFDAYSGFIAQIVSEHGKINGILHSAGVESTIPLTMISEKQYNDVFKINTFSFFELLKHVSKKKYASPEASFVAIASVMGITGQKGKTIYCSSKAALINGAKALALELASKKLRVNTISPAIVKTAMVKELFNQMSDDGIQNIKAMHPLGFGTTEDVAHAGIYLLSDASKWTTGTNLLIDGGYTAH